MSFAGWWNSDGTRSLAPLVWKKWRALIKRTCC